MDLYYHGYINSKKGYDMKDDKFYAIIKIIIIIAFFLITGIYVLLCSMVYDMMLRSHDIFKDDGFVLLFVMFISPAIPLWEGIKKLPSIIKEKGDDTKCQKCHKETL